MEKNMQNDIEEEPVSRGSPQLDKDTMEDGTTTSTIDNRPPTNVENDVDLTETGQPQYGYITGVKLWVVLVSVTLVYFLMMLDMSIVAVAIPRITSDFHSLSDVGWYGSAYLVSSCAVTPLTGKIYSYFSTKYIYLSFLALFEFGSAICGGAQSSDMLIIGRAIAGLGGSGLLNGALTIVGAVAPIEKRPAIMGIMMAISQLGIVCGPTLGGALTQYTSWRWCFYINLPVGAVAAGVLVLIQIPENLSFSSSNKPTLLEKLRKLDLTGFCLFAPFAAQFLLALEWGGTQFPWNSATIIGLFCGSGGTLAIFAAWEYRIGDGAMIPFSMIRLRIVWSSCLTVIFFFGSLMVYTYYLPIYFQAVKGEPPTLSGVYVLPGSISQMIMGIVSGVLVGKLGYYLPWSVASGILTAVAAGLMSTLEVTSATGIWVGYQIISGVGRGSGMQMSIVAIQNHLPPQKIPIGMSLAAFSQTFGGAIFLSLAQTIFSHFLVSGLAKFAPTVNPDTVVIAGASTFRSVIKPSEIDDVLLAYNWALNHCFYLSAGLAAGAFVTCWGTGWKNIKKSKVAVAAES